jgi:hypothetical protein
MEVGIDVGEPELSYDIDVIDPEGKPAAETSYGRKVHGKEPLTHARISTVVSGKLAPGKTMEEELYVNNAFDLSRPGKYTIQVSQFDFLKKVEVKSNKVTVTVNP